MAAEEDKGLNEALALAEPLYDFARYLTKSSAEADDLLQETFVRALAAYDRFEPGSNMKAWLFRILRNTFLDQRRRDKKQGRPTTLAEELPNDDALLRDDVEIDFLKNVVAEDIERALMDLPEESRLVVLLDFEGFDEEEIADLAGCARGTVKSRLSRARARLRAALAEYVK